MLRPWLVNLQISSDTSKPIYIRIVDSIIEAIQSGLLKSNEALPGSRQMSTLLGVNRNTITKAYHILLAEGWLTSSDRKGTFVSEKLVTTIKKKKKDIENIPDKVVDSIHKITFNHGLPDTSIAPIDELSRAYRRTFSRKAKWKMLDISSEYGDIKLREAISKMLNYSKGMSTSAEEIFITRGTQMSLFLTAHTLLTESDVVLVENPGYMPAWDSFRHAGAKIIPIDVDMNGINVDQVEKILKQTTIKAIYLTPHHQFPTTVTLSLERRLRLITLSNHYQFTIIEDDYDSDYYFGQRPFRPLSSYPELQNVVYFGTFSKLIAPAIRMGYIYSSGRFLENIGKLRRIIDFQGDNIMEQSLLELINSGDIRRHQKRSVTAYRERRDLFAGLLHTYIHNEKVEWQLPNGGLAFWLSLPDEVDIFKLKKKTQTAGLSFNTPDQFSFDKPIQGIRIGYASITKKDMEAGIKILSKFLYPTISTK